MKSKIMLAIAVVGAALAGAAGAETATVKLDDQITLKIYGYIKLDASYDTQRTQNGDLMYYVLPEVDGKDNEFNLTAKETRLGLDLAGPDVADIKTTGKVEIDFYGSTSANSPTPRLRLAYLDLAAPWGTSMRAGQDWETFITVLPKIVNLSLMNDVGALGLRRPQFRLTQEIPLAGTTKFYAKAAAARTIGEDIDGAGQDDGADAGFPTIQGNLGIESTICSRKATLSVSGHWGQESVDTVISNVVVYDDARNYDTWSVIGSLFLPLHARVAVQGSIWKGANLDTYYGGIGQGINKTLQTAIGAQGGWAQLVFDPRDDLNLNVGYGLDRPDDGDLSAGNRSENAMIFANVYFKVTSAATLALEYSNMKTSYKDAEAATNNRVQGAAIYYF